MNLFIFYMRINKKFVQLEYINFFIFRIIICIYCIFKNELYYYYYLEVKFYFVKLNICKVYYRIVMNVDKVS